MKIIQNHTPEYTILFFLLLLLIGCTANTPTPIEEIQVTETVTPTSEPSFTPSAPIERPTATDTPTSTATSFLLPLNYCPPRKLT